MGIRTRKQRTPDLKALEHIPAVREALRYVGLELLIRPLGQTAPTAVALGQTTTAQPPAPPAPIVIDTPERREWLQQQQEVTQALAAEQAKSKPQAKPVAALPAGQRRAIEEGFLRDAGVKTVKMAQFARDGGSDTVPAGAVESLSTLSEAT